MRADSAVSSVRVRDRVALATRFLDSDELFDLPDLLFDLDLFDLDLEWWCGATGQLR